ncbi:MAG TPA: hypothetical protein VHY84_27250 [Bryobacteraceae bacterium]|jgi:hypothetical protein|nr:hypothetical protein [Bryobacteraceae bacterium]
MVNCQYCEEPVSPGEVFPDFPSLQDVHCECAIRMFLGSAAHQLRECACFGGMRGDPPGMTRRQAAILAYDTYQITRAERKVA